MFLYRFRWFLVRTYTRLSVWLYNTQLWVYHVCILIYYNHKSTSLSSSYHSYCSRNVHVVTINIVLHNIRIIILYQTIRVYRILCCITITIIIKCIQGRVLGNRICDEMWGITGRIRKVNTGQRDQNVTFPSFGCSRISFVGYIPIIKYPEAERRIF